MPEGVPLHDLLGAIAVDDGLEAVERPGADFMNPFRSKITENYQNGPKIG
jgi:hypothetical protein